MKFFVEPTQPINMAELRKVLGRCGRAMPEDPSVVEYCEGIMQGFLSDGCIDGTPETPDALYAALQPFVDADEEAGSEAFVRALATIVASRERDEAAGRSPDGADEDGVGSGGGCESALGSTEGGATCAVQQPPGWPRAAAERESATEPAQPTSASASTPSQAPGDSRNPESSPRRALLEGVLSQNYARLDQLVVGVLGVLAADNPGPDETLVEYISSVLRDGLEEEEDASDLQEVLMGAVPEVQQLFSAELAGSFDLFLAKVSEVLEKEGQHVQSRSPALTAAERQHPSHDRADASAIQFTLRANLPSDDEGGVGEEEQEEEIHSPRQAQLRELFPARPLVDLRTVLDLAGGKVEEAIEKMFGLQELEAMCISSEAASAQQKADLDAFRAAMRERALTLYDKVQQQEAEEKGKGAVVKPLLKRDGGIDKAVDQLRAGGKKKNEVRYIDNQIVAHKGEKFLYTSTKNAAPEDPKTFIGLKVIRKKKGGPSPNLK